MQNEIPTPACLRNVRRSNSIIEISFLNCPENMSQPGGRIVDDDDGNVAIGSQAHEFRHARRSPYPVESAERSGSAWKMRSGRFAGMRSLSSREIRLPRASGAKLGTARQKGAPAPP